MIAQNLIDRLAEHKALCAAPRSELEWLVAHGSILELNPGQLVSRKGRQVENLYIVLSGRLALFIDRVPAPANSSNGMQARLPACCPIRGSSLPRET